MENNERTAYPVKVSDNKRYFVDQKGQPIFWLGDTQWELCRSFSLDDARTILENRKQKGFAFIQVMLFGVGNGLGKNINEENPWKDKDSLVPNEEYFKHVDAVVRMAGENGIVISLTLFHQRYREHMTLAKARAWARWLANRYRNAPNIVWSMTPEASEAFVPILRELAAGLKDGDGGCHLVTFKPDPSPFTSSFIHDEPWLDYNCMQTWKLTNLIYPFVKIDYDMKPAKPVVMAEGAYEAGTEYGFDVTPLWVRRQAYYSYFAGAHHTYGHNDSWRVLPAWKSALDAPGARQMTTLKKILTAREEWWYLVPDQSVFASGGRVSGEILNLGARHKDGRWVMAYLANPCAVSIHMGEIKAGGGTKVAASWVDPRSGDSIPAGRLAGQGVESFRTPDGWEDAILVLE